MLCLAWQRIVCSTWSWSSGLLKQPHFYLRQGQVTTMRHGTLLHNGSDGALQDTICLPAPPGCRLDLTYLARFCRLSTGASMSHHGYPHSHTLQFHHSYTTVSAQSHQVTAQSQHIQTTFAPQSQHSLTRGRSLHHHGLLHQHLPGDARLAACSLQPPPWAQHSPPQLAWSSFCSSCHVAVLEQQT